MLEIQVVQVSREHPTLGDKKVAGLMVANEVKTIYIDPGCPWQNGYAESFNSRFRRECLDREFLYTLSESRVVFADWRAYYNHRRPHRSLGLQSPAQFATNQSNQSLSCGRPTGSLRSGSPSTTTE